MLFTSPACEGFAQTLVRERLDFVLLQAGGLGAEGLLFTVDGWHLATAIMPRPLWGAAPPIV